MTIQTYFPTTNPTTSSSDPNAQSAEGYYWIGWSVLNTKFDPVYFAEQSITYGTRLADDNTTVDPYRFYRYLPTELDINSIPEFRIAYFNAVNRPDNGVIQREPDGTIAIDQFNQGPSIQPWAKLPQSTSLLNNATIKDALDQWKNVANIDNANIKITFAYVTGGAIGQSSGRTYLGAGQHAGQAAVFIADGHQFSGTTQTTYDLSVGTWGNWMLMHELGHVFGLPHPVPRDLDSLKNDIMAYPAVLGFAATKTPLTLGMENIAYIQGRYGANLSHNNTDTAYTFTSSKVNLGNGDIAIAPGEAAMTIWDGGGIDTIDASAFGSTQNVYINLNDGEFSAIGTNKNVAPTTGNNYNGKGDPDGNTDYNVGIAVGAQIENAKGGNGNDYLKGNDLANKLEGNGGADTLEGGLGNDTLIGEDGVDELFGGEGDDTYKAANGDTISGDHIGSVYLDVKKLNGGEREKGEQIYTDADGVTTYSLINSTLSVSNAGGSITINNFVNGDLGIHLTEKEPPVPPIPPEAGVPFSGAGNWQPRRDPLTLDLDGDGLETTGTGILNPIYFDQDGDGIKTSSGWVKPDDGFLVLDRNGNGTIDNGRELFGDSTILTNGARAGQTATDGFDALADLDSNADGKISSLDTQFANLRIWRDLNQDGISQTGELFTLASLNIASINVTKTANNQTLPNGNQIADLGTFTRADGSAGSTGTITGNLADINLVEDTFHRQFPDVLNTSTVANLPDMQGSGKVRDLRQAATQSTTLQSLLTNYSVATTRAQQIAQLDQLLDAWADTGGMAETMAQRIAAMPGYTRADGTVIPYVLASTNLSAEWQQKLHIVETFNGRYFFGLPGTTQTQGAKFGITIANPNINSINVQITVTLSQDQFNLLQQSYDLINDAVYDGLLLQTRFKPLLNQISLNVDVNQNASLDFSQVYASFETKIAQNAALGMADLIEFNEATRTKLASKGWQGYELLETKLRTLPITPELQAIYNQFNVNISNLGGNQTGTANDDIVVTGALIDYISGNVGDDVVYAGAGNDYINGGGGDDNLYGQEGDDYVYGDIGDDVLKGGAGNDNLNGGLGNDTYLFNLGDGQDIISNNSNVGLGVIESDVIQLGAGLTAANVHLRRDDFNRLIIEITNTTDKLTINDYFTNDASTNYAVQTIRFADGTIWSVADVKTKVLTASTGDDRITGYATNDNLSGAEGNDYLIGNDGNDTLNGGTGADILDAGTGDDSLLGGSGNDNLYGGIGNDVLEGGSENDTLSGHVGNDVLNGGSQNDTLDGGAGNDSLNGGSEDDTLYGGADDDNLQGGNGNDTLQGEAGNDSLNGGLGNDFLNGGEGLNTYTFARGDGQDTIDNSTIGRTDTLSFAAGILTMDVTLVRVVDDLEIRINNSTDIVTVKNQFTTSPITLVRFADGTTWNSSTLDSQLNISATIGSDVIRGKSLADNISGLAGFDAIYGYGGNDTISGGDGFDTLYGGDGYDILNGDADADMLYGGEGNDTLDGGTGRDTLVGGNGNDTYIYNLGGGIGSGVDTIEEVADASNSFDRVNFGVGITTSNTTYYKTGNDLEFRFNSYDYLTIKNFFLTTDNQYKVEQFAFLDGTVLTSQFIQALLTTPTSGNDYISGYDWADNINGLEGSDQLYGNGGDDTLIGAQGNDYLNGGIGNDLLDGGLDYDNLAGGEGNDTLIGGTSNDTLAGEAGDDVYLYQRGDGFDTITDTSGNDMLLLGTGILPADVSLIRDEFDLFLVLNNSEISIKLQNDQIDTIQFQNGTVWNLATIRANTVFGAMNTFTGTTGNDNYTIDNNYDVINEAANQGTDSVTSSVSYRLGTNVENLTLTGFLDINAFGNTLDNVITGNSGNNIIDGGGFYIGYTSDGADTLIGGAGNDIYFANNGDVVTELVGGGTDIIYTSSTGYVMQDNVESLVIVGNYQYYMVAYGNSLNNYMRARSNWFGQVLDGGTGADTMTGGRDTTFYVDNIGDVVGGSGNYKVYSSVDFTLAAAWDGTYLNSVTETLILTGSNAIKATGNGGKNVLDGRQNSAANLLEGGAGDDTYYAGINDIVIEQVGGGNDTLSIYAENTGTFALEYTLSGNIENMSVSTANTYAVNLVGSSENNRLDGNNGVNKILGLGGNDTIYGGTNWGDTLDGGDGNDNIGGNGWLYGGAGDDTLGATYGSVFTGGTGNDTMGGNSVDTFVYARGDGSDTIRDFTDAFNQTSDFRDRISFGAGITESDILLSRSGDNLIISIAGTNDTITVEQQFVPVVGTISRGIELFEFEDGSIWDAAAIEVRLARNNSNLASELADLLIGNSNNDHLLSLSGNDYVFGGAGDDTLEGGNGNDALYGNSGIDVLIGGVGDDTLAGGIGADTYQFGRGSGTDLIIDSKNNAEIDTILIDSNVLTSQVVVRASGLYNLDLTLSILGDSAQITIQNFYVTSPTTGGAKQVVFADGTVWSATALQSLAVTFFGTSAADVVNGTDTGSDKLFGFEGNDILNGLAGNDTLDGGLGADTMIGGFGYDTYIVDNAGDVITEENDGYIDTVEASISYTLGANVDNLTLTGSANINATGNIDSNSLTGNVGNNQLDGGAGADNMAGGLGDDVYIVNIATDVVTEYAGEGVDSVLSAVTYTLSSDVENLTLTGTNAINGTGNAGNNILTGNGAANRLTGADGHDTLEGGAGIDTMVGGLGDDTYIVDVTTDVVTEAASAGTDTVKSAVTYVLGTTSNLENLILTGTTAINGTGNTLANIITGNSAANVISGGTGADTMIGGAGNDSYTVDSVLDLVTENLNEGTDVVNSSVTYALLANIENLTLTGTTVINATGNDLANTLTGNSGINILDGGLGIDTMIGGLGNDTYVVDNTGDVVTETSTLAAELDTVQASISYLLGANLEKLTLTGAANINATGNTLANTLTGNAGNNILDGGAGIDTLIGGAGNDTYIVDLTATNALQDTTLTELAAGGTDTVVLRGGVVAAVSTITLGTELENLDASATGTTLLNLTGNTLANIITGNAANNALNGLAGNDTMIGGLGNDTYTIDVLTDVVTENLNEGTDLVNVAVATAGGTYVLAANVDNATLTNTVAYSLTGNALDNILTGNAAANTLNGGDGNDTLNGLAGNDSMIGGLGNDIYTIDVLTDVITENLNEGTDLVNVAIATAAGSYTLATNVENGTLTNAVAYNILGNLLNNTLVGNGANNVLTGAAGTDILTGGLGADTFDFNAITESLVGTSRDIITDFSHAQLDKIDLSTIDANTTLANDQAFSATILTSGAFTALGQLRLVGNILSGNTDSNFATSEFEIQLTGVTSLVSADFVL